MAKTEAKTLQLGITLPQFFYFVILNDQGKLTVLSKAVAPTSHNLKHLPEQRM